MKTSVLFLLCTLCVAGVHAKSTPSASITIANVEATPGSIVNVPVYATGFQNVYYFYADFVFDSNVLEVVGDGFFNIHPTIAVDWYLTNIIDDQTIRFVWFVFSPPGSIANGQKLFDMRFRFCDDLLSCAQNGTASVISNDESNSGLVINMQGGEANLTLNPGSVYANTPLQILDLAINGNGTVEVDGTPYTEEVIVPQGTTLQLNAIPGTDYEFDAWSGDLSGSTNPVNLIMNTHKSVTATFIPDDIEQYIINATAGPNGSISPFGAVVVNEGASQSFTITPNTGYHVADVLVDDASVGAVTGYTFTNVTDDHTIHATFAINQYTIAVSASPAAGGTVSGGGTFNHGTMVNLNASPNTGYNFVNWTEGGSVVSTNPSYSFAATANRTLVANFEEITYTVTFNVKDASNNPISGATISLNGTTNPAGNYVFSGLTAGEYGYTVTRTGYEVFTGDVSVSDDITVDVTLQLLTYTVSFGVTGGNGSLAATANSAPISSGDDVDHGTDLLFTATPNPGYRVKEWKLNGSLVAGHTETTLAVNDIDGAVNVSVEFEEIPPMEYTLTVTIAGSGSVTVDGDTYTVPVTVVEGTMLNLEAIAAEYWSFDGWTGDVAKTGNTLEVLMDGNKNIIATFIQQQFTLTVNTVGNGSVKVNGTTYTDVLTIGGGESVSLLAEPDIYWQFDNWSGALSGSENPKDLLMDGNKEVTAHFSLPTYTLTVTIVGAGDVTVGGESYTAPVTVAAGTTLNLEAIATAGYQFGGWSGAITSTNPTASILMDDDKAVTATFTEIPPEMYTLTVTIIGSGDVTVNDDAYTTPITVVDGTTLNLEAIAAEYWNFDGWSGDVSKTGNTLEVLMDGNKNIIATFIQQQFTLTVNTVGNGSVKVNGTTYTDVLTIGGGESVSLLAEPDIYWQFDNWSGALSGSENPKDLLMDGNKTVTAHFSQPQYTLTIVVEGNGSVNVEGAEYTEPVAVTSGTTLCLQAFADEGWQFDSWSGDLTGAENPKDLLMDGHKTVTANFSEIPPEMYTLTVSIVGSGSVTVDGDTYTTPITVVEGTTLTLEALAADWWDFDGWTGDVPKTGNTLEVLMNGNKNITATFIRQQFTLTVNTVGNGSVKVDGDTYMDVLTINGGETVSLLAEPDIYWQFNNWSGHLSGSDNPKALLMNGNKEVTANFSQPQYTLTILFDGNGSVNVEGAEYTEPVAVTAGTTLSLQAFADVGWQFDSWSDDLTGDENPKDLLMDGHKTVTANFSELPPEEYTLTVSIVGSGSVTVDGDTYTVPVTVVEGTTLNLAALAAAGYQFAGWSGAITGTNPTASILMDDDKAVTATFTEIPPEMYTLTVTIIGSGSVTVDGDTYTVPVTVVEGTTLNLEAIATAGYDFAGWSGAITGTNPTASILMDSDKDVAATFTAEHEAPEHREVHDVTISDGETACYDALKTITAWNFIVESGGEAHFLAGERIRFLPGTHIKAGAYLHARITTNEFCITEKEEDETMAGGAIAGVTGDEEESKMDVGLAFRVYPNPTTGSFTLEVERACADDQPVVEIMNMIGNLVLRQQLPAMALHIFSLERQQPGIYLIRVICGNQTATQRLIKR